MDQAILMVTHENSSEFELNENIEELKNLAMACEIETMEILTQKLKRKSITTYIGKGKVDEIKMAVEAQNANIVIFNVGLSPSQIRNLEEAIGCEVIDKNMLVLEIFSTRAVTPEAKAQVEIAQLKYVFPRMVGSYEHLGRQVSGFGNRNRGLGETKLELDRRNVLRRIQSLSKSLEEFKKTRQTNRVSKTQSHLPIVSLVGYTNAGKSSLMNALLKDQEDRKVFVKDMLFASLETYSRRVELDANHSFILNDTVGFIKDLPTELVPAFHATLEEIEGSDLLLHLVDVSNPFHQAHMKTISETLDTLDVASIPVLTLYNKIDLLDDVQSVFNSESGFISIKDNLGMDALKNTLLKILWKDEELLKFKIPYNKMHIVEILLRNHSSITQDNQDDGVYLELYGDSILKNKYVEFLQK